MSDPDPQRLVVSEEGVVYSGDDIIDVIKIVNFKDLNKLVSFQATHFYLEEEYRDEIVYDPPYTLQQGVYEQANVVKGLVGQVPEMKWGYDGSAKVAKAIIATMRGSMQLANPQ
ncbi:MAG: hypothetical protein HRT90_08475 [Candidatus Margulisbacteria bacterium]|nr:hypothetical protein [Candidatus Margulisiibacteriota bacterium]